MFVNHKINSDHFLLGLNHFAFVTYLCKRLACLALAQRGSWITKNTKPAIQDYRCSYKLLKFVVVHNSYISLWPTISTLHFWILMSAFDLMATLKTEMLIAAENENIYKISITESDHAKLNSCYIFLLEMKIRPKYSTIYM